MGLESIPYYFFSNYLDSDVIESQYDVIEAFIKLEFQQVCFFIEFIH